MRRPHLRRGDLVDVRWDDIEHITAWHSFADVLADKHETYRAAGYVVRSGPRFLTIAPVVSTQRGGSSSCAYRIPWGAIRRARRVRW